MLTVSAFVVDGWVVFERGVVFVVNSVVLPLGSVTVVVGVAVIGVTSDTKVMQDEKLDILEKCKLKTQFVRTSKLKPGFTTYQLREPIIKKP